MKAWLQPRVIEPWLAVSVAFVRPLVRFVHALSFCLTHGLPVVHKATRVDRRDVAQIITAITGAVLAAHKMVIEWKRKLDSKPTEDENEK